jgi:hypothetical protein
MVSGFDNVHIRSNLPRLEDALKYGNSAGDRYEAFEAQIARSNISSRIYSGFALLHIVLTRLFVSDHRMFFLREYYDLCDNLMLETVSELVGSAEEVS